MIKVLIAEDQALLRGTLAEVLCRDPELNVVAQCGRGDEVLALARETCPDVAMLDIDMPGATGLDVVGLLSHELPQIKVLMLTVFDRPGYLSRALAAGARGFLLKDTPPAELVDAIKKTAHGGRVVDPGLAVNALAHGTSPLTTRETELLSLVRSMEATTDLARHLHLSEGTVRNTLSTAMHKLHAVSRGQAARIAEDNGWL